MVDKPDASMHDLEARERCCLDLEIPMQARTIVRCLLWLPFVVVGSACKLTPEDREWLVGVLTADSIEEWTEENFGEPIDVPISDSSGPQLWVEFWHPREGQIMVFPSNPTRTFDIRRGEAFMLKIVGDDPQGIQSVSSDFSIDTTCEDSSGLQTSQVASGTNPQRYLWIDIPGVAARTRGTVYAQVRYADIDLCPKWYYVTRGRESVVATAKNFGGLTASIAITFKAQ